MPDSDEPRRFRLVVRDFGADPASVYARLKRVVKGLLKRYGFVCLECRELTEEGKTDAQDPA